MPITNLSNTFGKGAQTLSGRHLNLYEKHELLDYQYVATRPTGEQRTVLKALG